jgi:hypothetical protein
MDQATVTLWLSIVGTSVALVLAAIRVCEFFRDRRPKLSVVARLTSYEVEGNDLILLNSSKVPANLLFRLGVGETKLSGKERWIRKTAYEGTGSSGRRHLRHYCSATSAIFVELQGGEPFWLAR